MDNPQKTVLVADDNSAMAHVVQFNLEKAGFRVQIAANGEIAWQLVQTSRPDLLICDHQMPLMTGVDLCRRLRADRRFESLPIIMLTAKRMELDMQRLQQELNLVATFAKPFSPSQVVASVSDVLAPVSAS